MRGGRRPKPPPLRLSDAGISPVTPTLSRRQPLAPPSTAKTQTARRKPHVSVRSLANRQHRRSGSRVRQLIVTRSCHYEPRTRSSLYQCGNCGLRRINCVLLSEIPDMVPKTRTGGPADVHPSRAIELDKEIWAWFHLVI